LWLGYRTPFLLLYLLRVAIKLPFRLTRTAYRFQKDARVLLVLGLLRDVPALRRPLLSFLMQPRRWRDLQPVSLWSDLVRLAVLRGMRGKELVPGEPYHITLSWRDDQQTCCLIGTPAPHAEAGPGLGEAPEELRAALAAGHCRR